MQAIYDLLSQIVILENQEFEKPQYLIAAVMKLKRQYSKEHNLSEVITNTELLKAYRAAIKIGSFQRSQFVEKILTKRGIRSQSGIVPIQVLTKPFWCPGECIFCPNDATMPKSYINTEPGAMRALLNQFDPYKQTYNRLLSLYLTGHATDKIEMIVLGGTWDVYPTDYKRDFLKGLYDACNTFEQFMAKISLEDDMRVVRYNLDELDVDYPPTIEQSMKNNETSNHRIIGLTIETRPEYITDENCRLWREWGVTRLEMGLQSMFDDVLSANKRGHSVQQARQAVHKMRQYGFKFSIHFMPGLYGSTLEKDIESFHLAYTDPWIKPDEIKFYPTSVIPNTELYEMYKRGEYKPLAGEALVRVIKEVQRNIIPPYTRIKRLIRDIPSTEIVAGNDITNLRQITERSMLQENQQDVVLRKKMYGRLYPDATYFASIDDALQIITQAQRAEPRPLDEKIPGAYFDLSSDMYQTYIVGQKPDVEIMRQYVALDTRAREMRNRTEGIPSFINLIIRKYDVSAGAEYFISLEDELGYIYGFTRLLLPEASAVIEWSGLGQNTALIRELHVYGQVAKIQQNKQGNGNNISIAGSENIVGSGNKTLGTSNIGGERTAQHQGFGSHLMEVAERIAAVCSYTSISVISGVGVREYYKKLGYTIVGTYMMKKL